MLKLNDQNNGYNGIQYGFEWDTDHYVEHSGSYSGQQVLFYQFKTNNTGDAIRVVPDGCVDLLFCCDPNRPSAAVCGTVLIGKSIPFHKETVYFGVRLSPKLSMLLPGLALKEIIDVQAPFEDTLSSYKDVCFKITAKKEFRQRIHVFEQEFLSILISCNRPHSLVDYCLNEMYRTSGAIAVQELADGAGYSARYIRTKFEEAVGVPPKLYTRIIRFQHSLNEIWMRKASLSDLANEQGYFDQAHFVKEFKAFSQLTPDKMKKRIIQGSS